MKHKRILMLAGGLLLAASSAGAVDLDWNDKNCVTVDRTFHVCKPSGSWDTQSGKGSRDEAVRWVLHRSGANPIIKLLYKPATGKTAHDYAKVVREDLELRGLAIKKVENRVVNGRNVSLITASDTEAEGKLNYLVAVYRDQEKGLLLECTAGKEDFTFMSQEFMASVNSVRFVR